MWSNLLSAALLYGVLSTTIVVAQFSSTDTTITAPFTSPSPTVVDPGSGDRLGHSSLVDPVGKDTNTVRSSTATGSVVDGSASETNGPEASGGRNNNTGAPSVASDHKASGGKSNNTGAIAGGVVGGVLFLVLVGALIFFLRKRKKARDPFGSMEKSGESSSTLSQSLIAY